MLILAKSFWGEGECTLLLLLLLVVMGDEGIVATEEYLRRRIDFHGPSVSTVTALSLAGGGPRADRLLSLGYALLFFHNLTRIDLSRNALTSLEGLEHCALLTHINCYGNNIGAASEIGRLRFLPRLEELDLRLNPVTRVDGNYRLFTAHTLNWLKRLDGRALRASEKRRAEALYGAPPGPAMLEPLAPVLEQEAIALKNRSLHLAVDAVDDETRVDERWDVEHETASPPYRAMDEDEPARRPAPAWLQLSRSYAPEGVHESDQVQVEEYTDDEAEYAAGAEHAVRRGSVSFADEPTLQVADLGLEPDHLASTFAQDLHRKEKEQRQMRYEQRRRELEGEYRHAAPAHSGASPVRRQSASPVRRQLSASSASPVRMRTPSSSLPSSPTRPLTSTMVGGARALSHSAHEPLGALSSSTIVGEQSSVHERSLHPGASHRMSVLVSDAISDCVDDVLLTIRQHDDATVGSTNGRAFTAKMTRDLREKLRLAISRTVLSREQEIDRLRDELANAREFQNHTRAQLDRSQMKGGDLDDELRRVREENEMLRAENDTLSTENAELADRADQLQSRMLSTEKDLTQSGATLVMLKESHAALMETHRRLLADLDARKASEHALADQWRSNFDALKTHAKRGAPKKK